MLYLVKSITKEDGIVTDVSIEGIFKNLPVKAFDIVEVSPKLDVNDITSWLALKTIYEVFKYIGE